ncbi:MAG: enoyl-CoA hydratase/isomerase family protein [Candidatus Omnitrophica bacterium]|nr:enoyl-CoA hydratase/isomerase family protein [Candidatus Omnitrophota bacterium]
MSISLKVENDVGFIEFDQDDSKVNLLTSDMLRRLDGILDGIGTREDLNTLVVVSKKKGVFIAGADIKEIEAISEAKDGKAKSQEGQKVLNKLEDLKIPTLAVIDGVALGGGCELALACDYRLATFNPKVRIGCPEVNLGFNPGFGGTYRLPRIVGLAEGMKMILAGRPVPGGKALKTGLVDALVPEEGLSNSVSAFIAKIHKGKIPRDKYKRKRKKKGVALIFANSLIVQYLTFSQSRKSVLKLTKGFYPAPLKTIDLISKSYYAKREKGMDLEAKTFGELAVTEISKNLVQVFYLSEKYKKLTPKDADGIRPAAIEKCGVCGAGTMGGGIAQLLSSRGVWVRLKDINHGAVALGLSAAAKIYKGAVKRRKMKPADARKSFARISGTLDYSGFGNADLVIEAVVEKMSIKKSVFKELSGVVKDGTVIATNTSALSVSEMANEAKDPSKVVGFHFFNPVHRMPLVEVVATPMTSKETIVTALAFAKRLGKTPILVKDTRGFIVNRVLLGYINEAGRILEECGRMVEIDELMTDFGLPMGPFTLSDEVGLDVGIKVLETLAESLGGRFAPVGSFKKVFEKGLLGKKTKKGFYTYSGKDRDPNEEIEALLGDNDFRPFDAENYRKRLIYLMINEAARCLEDGVVDDPGAIDVGMIFGTGFPPFRGGLLRWADSVGIANIVDDLERFTNKENRQQFEPCAYLLSLRDEKKGFYGA